MFDKTFCAGPWFHTGINNSGGYTYCRWSTEHNEKISSAIQTESPIHWFQQGMNQVRRDLLDGKVLPGCANCHTMEQHGKISGRQKQLLKVGVIEHDFARSMLSSAWSEFFQKSLENHGATDLMPVDWQINLGNFCNSACVFCQPYSSSRLASEFKRIGITSDMPKPNWAEDSELLASFIDMLVKTPQLTYLHFIGGETMITPAFKTILHALIQHDIAGKVIVGLTTNLTVWDDVIVDLLTKFKQVHLGLSIECLHPVNDYARYPSELVSVLDVLHKWISIKDHHGWLAQLRITPTALTVTHLDTIYEFAVQHQLGVESCNFLYRPEFMRPTVLPQEYRQHALKKLQTWIHENRIVDQPLAINTRNPGIVTTQLVQDAQSYVDYLSHADDESFRAPDLVNYLMRLERSRGNRILDYLPEYENFFRSAGYKD